MVGCGVERREIRGEVLRSGNVRGEPSADLRPPSMDRRSAAVKLATALGLGRPRRVTQVHALHEATGSGGRAARHRS